MLERLDIPCVVLAGGESRRFGSPKGLARLGGEPLIAHIIHNLERQTRGPIALNANPLGAYKEHHDQFIEDCDGISKGPLAGIHAAMHWALGMRYDVVATVPVDAPFLPANLLIKFVESEAPVFATTLKNEHYVIGLWKTADFLSLQAFLENGSQPVKRWIESCEAKPCIFDHPNDVDPFLNINTPEDLKYAHSLL